jgi:hypothetical protein
MNGKKISFQRISEILNRITGISTPIAGISWEPPKLDIEIARNLIIFLENRRALFENYHQEYPPYVSRSILEIREQLTEYLQQIDAESELSIHLRKMREACIEFMSDTEDTQFNRINYQLSWDAKQRLYFRSLGKLRVTFGYYISLISVAYGIDIDSNLAKIIPSSPDSQSKKS